MNFHIRLATHQDAPAITRFLQRLGNFRGFEEEKTDLANMRVSNALESNLLDDSHKIWVAEGEDHQIIGYVAIHWLPYLFLPAPEGYISELFVLSDFRGNGLGGALLETAIQEARQRGCWRLQLINSRERESYQRSFYAKHGWAEREDMADFVFSLKPEK